MYNRAAGRTRMENERKTPMARTRHWLGVMLILALIATACSSDVTGTSTTEAGGEPTTAVTQETTGTTTDSSAPSEIVVGCSDGVPSWDAWIAFENDCGAVGIPLVFDVVAFPTSDLSDSEGIAAASITPNDDFSVWTVSLRPGMLFHNDDPVTSADLKFTLDRIAESEAWSYTLGGFAPDAITQVDIVDDLTVAITPPSPNAEIEALGLASFAVGILPKDFGGMTEEDFWTNPYGSGPYRLVSWTPSDEADLEKFDGYHTPAWQNFDRITLKGIPDDNARILGLESGELDLGLRLPTNASAIVGSDDVELLIGDPSAVSEMIFLANAPPFDDVEFRRAVWFALDREDLLAGAWDGVGNLPRSVIPSALPDATPGSIAPVYDLDLARQHLADSAYSDGAEFELLVVDGDGPRQTAAQIIQSDLAEVGITVTITSLAFAEFFDRFTTGGHQAVLWGYEAVVSPPSDIIGYYFATAGFFGGWDTTEALDQFLTVQAAGDPAVKQATIAAYETMMADGAYSIPLAERFWVAGHRTELRNVVMNPTGFIWINRATR